MVLVWSESILTVAHDVRVDALGTAARDCAAKQQRPKVGLVGAEGCPHGLE